jgi:hypothetical protein
MTWTMLSDDFWAHPKVLKAGPEAVALFVRALSRAADALSDGFISRADLALLTRWATPSATKPERLAQALVDAGLWEVMEDGWMIHDYHDYNRSADEERVRRRQRRDARRKGGEVRVATARRGRDGRLLPAGAPAGQVEPQLVPTNQARSRPRTRTNERYLLDDRNAVDQDDHDDADPWVDWDPAWTEFREAWNDRFDYPPSSKHREHLWALIDDRPHDAAVWVRQSAPWGHRGRDRRQPVPEVVGLPESAHREPESAGL